MAAWREAGEADRAFLQRLDASLHGWLDAVEGLAEEQRVALVDMQTRAREQAYRAAWPQARCLVIEQSVAGAARPIGRIWYARSADALHLVDIALLPEHRGRGVGAACMARLIDEATAAGLALTLQVAEDNPARRLYARLGFRCVARRPPYLGMRLEASAVVAGKAEDIGLPD